MSGHPSDFAEATPPLPRGFEYDAYHEQVWEANPDVPSSLVGPMTPGPVVPPVNPKPPKSQALGIASLILGLVSVPLGFIPVVNVLSIITGTLAIVLGVAALRRGLPKPLGIVGMLAGIGGIAITTVVLGMFWLFGQRQTFTVDPVPTPAVEVFDYSVEYNAWAPGEASVSWGVGDAATLEEPLYAQELFSGSWSSFDQAFQGGDLAAAIYVNGEPGRLVSCEVLVNGAVVDQQSGVGSVSCQVKLP